MGWGKGRIWAQFGLAPGLERQRIRIILNTKGSCLAPQLHKALREMYFCVLDEKQEEIRKHFFSLFSNIPLILTSLIPNLLMLS